MGWWWEEVTIAATSQSYRNLNHIAIIPQSYHNPTTTTSQPHSNHITTTSQSHRSHMATKQDYDACGTVQPCVFQPAGIHGALHAVLVSALVALV